MVEVRAVVSDDDRAILLLPDTRKLRQRIALLGSGYVAQVDRLRGHVPSYVHDAARALVDAMTRWEQDERILTCGDRH